MSVIFEPDEGTDWLAGLGLEFTPDTLTREDIASLVDVWQERLRLTHWEIRIDWENEPGEDELANVNWSFYDVATLRFAATYPMWSRREANWTVVHELMHIVMRDLQEGVESAERVLPASAYRLFDARFQHELEGVVDRTAALLIELGGVV